MCLTEMPEGSKTNVTEIGGLEWDRVWCLAKLAFHSWWVLHSLLLCIFLESACLIQAHLARSHSARLLTPWALLHPPQHLLLPTMWALLLFETPGCFADHFCLACRVALKCGRCVHWLSNNHSSLVLKLIADILATRSSNALSNLLPRRSHLICGSLLPTIKNISSKSISQNFLG